MDTKKNEMRSQFPYAALDEVPDGSEGNNLGNLPSVSASSLSSNS